MLLRISLAVIDFKQKKELLNRLFGLSMAMEIEFDIAEYTHEFDKMIHNMKNSDMIFLDEEYVKLHKENLYLIYKSNNKCFPILVGVTKNNLYNALSLRPIGYIDEAKDIIPDDESDKIRRLCNFILDGIRESFKNKSDNSTIYISTKQESFAVDKNAILYCQSDLKYVLFFIDDGRIIRKLDKLQDIAEKYLWDFVRIHQSFLINPKRVVGLDKSSNEIILYGDLHIPISRKYSNIANKIVKNGN